MKKENYMGRRDAVIQNLEDAGCDPETVAQFMEAGMAGNRQNQLKLLEQHRKRLLESVHQNEKYKTKREEHYYGKLYCRIK